MATRTARDLGAGLARGLGWLSLGLGLIELTAPGVIERVVGVRGPHRALLPAIGLREIVSGIGILRARGPLPSWLWARVAGDALDLGLLLLAMRRARDRDVDRGVDGHPPRSIAVDRPLEECRRLWQAFAESPRFERAFGTLRSVDFEAEPAGGGTLIRVCMPTGSARAEHAAGEALREFKQVVETGAGPRTRGQPASRPTTAQTSV